MGLLYKIREAIWPLLDPYKEPNKEFSKLDIEDLTICDSDLDKGLTLALKFYDTEENRRHAVESKSTIFIGAIGFVIAILLDMTLGFLINTSSNKSYLTIFLIIMWIIIAVYFSRSGWFALKVLEKKAFHCVGYKDFIKGNDNYSRKIIIDIINKTRLNSKIINEKVDNMVMAQEYFKRAIIATVIYFITAGIISLFTGGTFYNKVFNFLFNSKGLLYVNISWFILNALMGIYLRMKLKRLKKEK